MEPKVLKKQQSEQFDRLAHTPPSDGDTSDDSYWYSSTDSEAAYESPVSDEECRTSPREKPDDYISSSKIPKESRYRLTMWTAKTHYDVVKEVSKF